MVWWFDCKDPTLLTTTAASWMTLPAPIPPFVAPLNHLNLRIPRAAHRYPRPDQPQEIVQNKQLRVWCQDMSGADIQTMCTILRSRTVGALFNSFRVPFILWTWPRLPCPMFCFWVKANPRPFLLVTTHIFVGQSGLGFPVCISKHKKVLTVTQGWVTVRNPLCFKQIRDHFAH